jgi:hypothetical protein
MREGQGGGDKASFLYPHSSIPLDPPDQVHSQQCRRSIIWLQCPHRLITYHHPRIIGTHLSTPHPDGLGQNHGMGDSSLVSTTWGGVWGCNKGGVEGFGNAIGRGLCGCVVQLGRGLDVSGCNHACYL